MPKKKEPDTTFIQTSQRQNPPPTKTLNERRTWGGRLLVELNSVGRSPEWLGEQVGYNTPSSMRQVINGHQGVSREVYDKILLVLPVMAHVFVPPLKKERQGNGSGSKHKEHDYPPGSHVKKIPRKP